MNLQNYRKQLDAYYGLTKEVMTSIYDVAYKLNNLKTEQTVLLLISFVGLNPNLSDENNDRYCGVGIDFVNTEYCYLVGKTEDKMLSDCTLDEKLEVLRLIETYYENLTVS